MAADLPVNVPICLGVLAWGSRVKPAGDHRERSRVDMAGAATLSVAVLCIVVPLTVGRDAGWPAWTWAALAASIPVLALFLLTERRVLTDGRTPLVNTSILTRPSIAWGLVGLAGCNATYFALLFALAQYLQIGLGYTALFSGLILVPWVAAFGLAGPSAAVYPSDSSRPCQSRGF